MTFQFHVQLQGVTNPVIWRRLLIPSGLSFHAFHHVLQMSFGWYDSHLYEFSPKWLESELVITQPDYEAAGPFENSDEYRLEDFFKNKAEQIEYVYDFGDCWQHAIQLEDIITESTLLISTCIDGAGKCPPEDVGGVNGFHQFKLAVNNPNHEEYLSFREWLSLEGNDRWDSTAFSREQINANLRHVTSPET